MNNSLRWKNRADDRGEPSGELSDADLEQVIGGLSRAWYVDGSTIANPTPLPFTVTALVSVASLDVECRASA